MEFTVTPAFTLDEGCGTRLKVSVTHDNATGAVLSVSFHDRDQMVSVPADLWARVTAAVTRHWEF